MVQQKPIRRPRDKFKVGDYINVSSSRSKHYNRTGTITSLGLRRITVSFDDRLPGSYVDYSHASKIDQQPSDTASDETEKDKEPEAPTSSKLPDETARLLEHLAFTAAAIVSSTGSKSKRGQELQRFFHASFKAQCSVLGELSDAHTPHDGE
jgi:hypothetical protein